MFLKNSPLSQFKVTNLIDILGSLLVTKREFTCSSHRFIEKKPLNEKLKPFNGSPQHKDVSNLNNSDYYTLNLQSSISKTVIRKTEEGLKIKK
jgi:hypothetical protein